MHLNIKNDEAHQLATELSRITGESLTAAVTSALRERLERQRRLRGRGDIAERLMAIGQRYARLPDGEETNPDAIIGYNEDGLPG
jgi:antitoxin VapB